MKVEFTLEELKDLVPYTLSRSISHEELLDLFDSVTLDLDFKTAELLRDVQEWIKDWERPDRGPLPGYKAHLHS